MNTIVRIIITTGFIFFLLVPMPSYAASADVEEVYACAWIAQVFSSAAMINECDPMGGTLTNTLGPASIAVRDVHFDKVDQVGDTPGTVALGKATIKVDPVAPAGYSLAWGGFSICEPEDDGDWIKGEDTQDGPYYMNGQNNWANDFSGYRSASLSAGYTLCAASADADRKYVVWTGIGEGNAGATLQGIKHGGFWTPEGPGMAEFAGIRFLSVNASAGAPDTANTSNTTIDVQVFNECGGSYPSLDAMTLCFNTKEAAWAEKKGVNKDNYNAPTWSAPFVGTVGLPSTATGTSGHQSLDFSWTSGKESVGPTTKPCRRFEDGKYIVASICTWRVFAPNTYHYLYFNASGASGAPYNTFSPTTSPKSYFASMLPTHPSWATGSPEDEFDGYQIRYKVYDLDIFDEVTVVPEADGLNEEDLTNSGLCLDMTCVMTTCLDMDQFLSLSRLWCFFVPPDFSWAQAQESVTNSMKASPMWIGIREGLDQIGTFATFLSMVPNECGKLSVGTGSGLFVDTEVNLCSYQDGINWDFWRGVAGVPILVFALWSCLGIIKSIVLFEKQVKFGFFDSDEEKHANGWIRW